MGNTMDQIRAFLSYIGEFNTVTVLLRIFLAVIAGAFHQDVMIETIPAKSGLPGSVGFVVSTMSRSDYEKIKQEFNQIDEISFVVPG